MRKKWLSSLSIRSILMLSFIPLILLILVTYYGFFIVSSKQLQTQTEKNINNINNQISTSLSHTLNNVYEKAETVASNWYFFNMRQNILDNNTDIISPANFYRLYQILENQASTNTEYFRSVSLHLDNKSISVFLSNKLEEQLLHFEYDYNSYKDIVSNKKLTWVFPKKNSPLTTTSQRANLGLMMLLGDENSATHGFILFELNEDLFNKEIENAKVTIGSQFAIINKNEVFWQTGSPINENALSKIPIEDNLKPKTNIQFLSDDNFFFYTPVNVADNALNLGVLAEIPTEEIMLNQKPLTKALALVIVLFLICCALTYYIIYFMVSKPIIKINKFLLRKQDLTTPAELSISGSCEIQLINQTINDFLARIRNLISNLNYEMDERRISELNILYEQINPHFLYNILDTIYQLCDLGEIDSAMEMTHALATFYQIGVSKGVSFITLEEECTHAVMYLSIMKIRYADFSYEIKLPEELKKYVSIKKLLQPIIENAIFHGIHPAQDCVGWVKLPVSLCRIS